MTHPANDNGVTLHLGDALEVLAQLPDSSVDALITDPPAGISFMGKSWDSDKGGRDAWIAWLAGVMRECLRAMKPGAHGLVWALPRTSHWTATALEDAGFEVRDVITHHFGTGFPKSLDVSKAIDKALGVARETIRVDAAEVRNPKSIAGGHGVEGGDRPWMVAAREKGFHEKAGPTPATAEAAQWEGWGTALKPASEHWILIRKPFDGTVAATVQEHGTGAINIDACRIGTDGGCKSATPYLGGDASNAYGRGLNDQRSPAVPGLGRWPANLVLSHADDCAEACAEGCPVRELDGQSGERKPGAFPAKQDPSRKGWSGGWTSDQRGERVVLDSGGASRFFYVAKPSRAERGADNKHPTVKSIALMSWLIRLITPPGGLVLDPFAGSGTTGVAAVRGGWGFVGIEREAEYHAIAEGRIRAAG